jgi:hypothetical protein
MHKKTKIILSGIGGFVFFPLWIYTLYLVFFDKPTAKNVRTQYPKGFVPKHIANNLAIDATEELLWCRGTDGVERTFQKEEIDSTTLNGLEGTNPVGVHYFSKNSISINTFNFDCPRVTVLFDRYSDISHKGANANREEALKWHGMLRIFFAKT